MLPALNRGPPEADRRAAVHSAAGMRIASRRLLKPGLKLRSADQVVLQALAQLHEIGAVSRDAHQ